MTKIATTLWEIEPHTEAKHAILRKYLDAWLPIITRWNGKVLYIDGFAGPGEYIGAKDGSPIIAVKAILEHRTKINTQVQMLFIEADKDRCEFLKQKISALTIPNNVKPECICSKFEQVMGEIVTHLEEQKKQLAPAFIFIDPFGFTGIPFDLIKKFMEFPSCEVFITFMYEEINRFVSDQKLWDNLKQTFGTEEWKKVLTETTPRERSRILHDVYKAQLEQEAKIKYVHSFKMINKTNKTDYFLFFGTNSIVGLKKMKEAMWNIDESGLFQFSDATYNPDQPELFKLAPDFYKLKGLIVSNFKGKKVSVEDIEEFVVVNTSFRETHYKRQILREMEKASPPEIKANCLNKTRIKGTFPPGCIIEFLS